MALNATYQLVALAVAAVSLMRGYRRGLTGQVPDVLGFAFGVVGAHVLCPSVGQWMAETFPFLTENMERLILCDLLSATAVYAGFFMTFRLLTGVLRSAMEVFDSGILDSILGSAFSLVKYMMPLSVVYNIMLCVNPASELMRCHDANDGNVASEVLSLAPALLGCGGADELSHEIQLREARKISCNQIGAGGVMEMATGCVCTKEIKENA